MNDVVILNPLAFEIHAPRLMKRLRIQPNTRFEKDFLSFKDQAMTLARPRGMYRMTPIQSKSDTGIVADHIRFTSRVLRVNLDKTHCLYPFLVTCGLEAETWVSHTSDLLHRFWMDSILQEILYSAGKALQEHIIASFGLGKTAQMSPGEFEDWPLSEQQPLFSLLGDTQKALGVRLTSGLMMKPVKSCSGVIFSTEEDFHSCMLCSQSKCTGRRAPFNKDLYDQKYRL